MSNPVSRVLMALPAPSTRPRCSLPPLSPATTSGTVGGAPTPCRGNRPVAPDLPAISPARHPRVSDVQSPCSNPASLPSGELKIVLVPAPRTGQVAVLSEAALQLSPRQRGSSSRPRRLPNAGSGKGRAERASNTHIVPCPWSTERRVSTPPKGVVADAVSSLSRPAITWVGY